MSDAVGDDGASRLEAAEPEPRTRRPVLFVALAGFLLMSLVGAITAFRAIQSNLAGPGVESTIASCAPGDIAHRTQAGETAAEFLDRNGYPLTILPSAAALRDVNGQALCPEGSSLETCKPGPDHVVCLPPPPTVTPAPLSTERSSGEDSGGDGSERPTRTPRPTPTPTATPVYFTPVAVVCGDQVCNPAYENSDVCPQDCHCVDNGMCEAGEGANCLDCGAQAGTCGSPCSDSSQCGSGLACASGVCWDACQCQGNCGGGSDGGGPTQVPWGGGCPDPGPYCSCGGAPDIVDCYDGCGNYLYSYVDPSC